VQPAIEVRLWHFGDIAEPQSKVRFWVSFGHRREGAQFGDMKACTDEHLQVLTAVAALGRHIARRVSFSVSQFLVLQNAQLFSVGFGCKA
jgi:hypothetical protein